MEHVGFDALNAAASSPEKLEKTVEYMADHLRLFLRRQERILICFPNRGVNSLGGLLEKAVQEAGGIPLFWGPDLRWKALLRQAFMSRATAITAPPLIVMGLTKLAKATGTPLYIRNVLTAGYPCQDWMIDGMRKGLDCSTWGCFDPGAGAVVSGFSCGQSRGVHLRQEEYTVEIMDSMGHVLPEGSEGEIVLYPKDAPQLRYHTGERGRLALSQCICGRVTPRLLDIQPGRDVDPVLIRLQEELLSWTSILDCRLEQGPYGLEMEIVRFPGEKLPKLPSCAKQIVRPWDPERDMPFHQPYWT